MRLRSETARAVTVSLTILLAPGADLSSLDFSGSTIYRTRIAGRLEDTPAPLLDLPTVQSQLALLGTPGHATSAFLILTPTGGQLFPYTSGVAVEQSAASIATSTGQAVTTS